jgi:hypothetical protein
MDGLCRLPDGPQRLPQSEAAQLRASVNSICCCCCMVYYYKCTQNTDMIGITHGVSRHFSSNKYRISGSNYSIIHEISRPFSGDFCSSLASIALEVNRTIYLFSAVFSIVWRRIYQKVLFLNNVAHSHWKVSSRVEESCRSDLVRSVELLRPK